MTSRQTSVHRSVIVRTASLYTDLFAFLDELLLTNTLLSNLDFTSLLLIAVVLPYFQHKRYSINSQSVAYWAGF